MTLEQVVERWGTLRVSHAMHFMGKGIDSNGLAIYLEATPERIDKMLSAVYATEYVTVDHDLVIVRGTIRVGSAAFHGPGLSELMK